MNIDEARINMLKQQCRTWEVYDETLLTLLYDVHREDFVPLPFQSLAFADMALPLGHEQSMFMPKAEARLLDALKVQPNERVLEIGTGSGYLTALLGHQAKHVESVDIFVDFIESAAKKLSDHAIRNVTLQTADAMQRYRQHASYDVIVITASLPSLPKSYLQSLTKGGRLFVILGHVPVMQATLVTKTMTDEIERRVLFDTYVLPMINAPETNAFVL